MDILERLGNPGYVLALICAAFGSALGTSAAGMAALGAWKKCFCKIKTLHLSLLPLWERRFHKQSTE